MNRRAYERTCDCTCPTHHGQRCLAANDRTCQRLATGPASR
ncbi:hypothetical protein [Verrucosispora sp. WMMD1129]|nr:hypothetical protein [Verrucosispora sp. WMMD1129]